MGEGSAAKGTGTRCGSLSLSKAALQDQNPAVLPGNPLPGPSANREVVSRYDLIRMPRCNSPLRLG